MPSREVASNQTGIHENLQAIVAKHLAIPWQKPVSDYSLEQFAAIRSWLDRDDLPLILDSGCGTGESSVTLAKQFPEFRILGFDRSEVRLNKLRRKTTIPGNCFTIRANAEDLWRQLVEAGIYPQRHYLLYPNPYPKSAHLKKRWHGSPVFPCLIALGGQVELRSNWKLYLEEFAVALHCAAGIRSKLEPVYPHTPISPFERKYRDSQHRLWRLQADLSNQNHQAVSSQSAS